MVSVALRLPMSGVRPVPKVVAATAIGMDREGMDGTQDLCIRVIKAWPQGVDLAPDTSQGDGRGGHRRYRPRPVWMGIGRLASGPAPGADPHATTTMCYAAGSGTSNA